MHVGEGRESVPSIKGAVCSVFLLIIVATFVGYKFDTLLGRRNIDIVQAVIE